MEQRTIAVVVFCLTFIAGFTILLGLIPNQLLGTPTKQYVPREVSDFFPDVDLTEYEEYVSIQINNTGSFDDAFFSLGGRQLRFYSNFNSTPQKIMLIHRYGLNLMWEEAMDWYNKIGAVRRAYSGSYSYLPLNYLTEDYAKDYQPYKVKCEGLGWGSSKFNVEARFGFNTSLYSTPTEAWYNDGLHVLFGIGIDDINSSLNAWDLVGKLMTFQTLEIFGNSGTEAVALNTLLAFPIMIAMIVAAVVIILEIIPF